MNMLAANALLLALTLPSAAPAETVRVRVLQVLASRVELPTGKRPELPKELKPYSKPLQQAFGPKSKEHYNHFELIRGAKEVKPFVLEEGKTRQIALIEDCELHVTPLAIKKKLALKTVLYKIDRQEKTTKRKKIYEVLKPNRHRLFRTPFCRPDDDKRIFIFISYEPIEPEK